MNKRIEINLVDPYINDYGPDYTRPEMKLKTPRLYHDDCKHILEKARKDISYDEALDVLIATMYTKKIAYITIDLDMYNEGRAPAKEMTLEEIQKELGYKIKIVEKK